MRHRLRIYCLLSAHSSHRLRRGETYRERDVWYLLFVLIRQGLGGGSGPQRLIRALGEETGNPILAFHRPSFSPSFERAPHHTTAENPFLGGDLLLYVFLMVR
jgi:hypothetical protein